MNDNKILVFDVETTGTSSKSDQIIELCIQFGVDEGSQFKVWRIKPDVPINPMAQKVHGISMGDLKDCPKFGELAEELWAIFEESEVLIAYNLEFDLEFVREEFLRVGKGDLDVRAKKLVDPYRIWAKSEPRNLAAAHQRFVGKAMKDAHTAKADVQAAAAVLEGMKKEFALDGKSWDDLASISGLSRTNWVGPSKHFVWSNEQIVFGFGKHRERSLTEVVAEDDGGYLSWILNKDFPDHVKQIVQSAKDKSSNELIAWAKSEFNIS